MRRALAAAFAVSFFVLPAAADVAPDPRPITWFQCQSGNTTPSTITSGGTAQPLFGSNANVKPPIRGLYVYNPQAAAENLYVNLAGTAVANATSAELLAGGVPLTMGPGTIVAVTATVPSVVAASGSHAFTCFYGQ